MTAVLLTPAALASGTADLPLLDAGGIHRPLLGVDLDAPHDPAAIAAVGRSDRVLVGVRTAPGPLPPLAGALDLVLVVAGAPGGTDTVAVIDPHAELAELTAAAEANPGATLVLVGLLRDAPVDVRAALDLESLAYSTLLGGPEFARWLAARGPRPLPPTVSDPVLLDRDGAELTITLNRARRRNAFGAQVRDALVEGLLLAVDDPTVERVVLTGAGPAFCSGGDLDEFGTTPDPVTAHLVRTRGGAGRLVAGLADRVEARLHGPCVGAGIELPAFAGRVLAAPGTTFRLPEVAMGLIPGAGGTVSIPRRIGRRRTLYLALSGRTLDVATALDWGLVDGPWEADHPTRAPIHPSTWPATTCGTCSCGRCPTPASST